jgi:hypothetical protein
LKKSISVILTFALITKIDKTYKFPKATPIVDESAAIAPNSDISIGYEPHAKSPLEDTLKSVCKLTRKKPDHEQIT